MLSKELLNWYYQNRRNLPWRETTNPYFIWVSEIILQQTKVEQGLPYYTKFIDKFPTIEILAKASEDEILRLWQGLGYYSRARNMQKAARLIQEKYKGRFPESYEELLTVPGIGKYTAAAISSIAFNIPKAVLDGNVFRVLSRYYGVYTPQNSSLGAKEFSSLAQKSLREDSPGDYNQAIMELGAKVCTPKNPLCKSCPIQSGCFSVVNKSFNELPVKLKKAKTKPRFFHYFVFGKNNKVALYKRSLGEIWEGLYEFPIIETNSPKFPMVFNLTPREKLFEIKQVLSHQTIFASFWKIPFDHCKSFENYQLYSKKEVEVLPKHKLVVSFLNSISIWED